MLDTIVSKFKPAAGPASKAATPADIAADSVTRLERKRSDAEAAFDVARAAHSIAALAFDDGVADAEIVLVQARKVLHKTEERFVESLVSLDAAKARYTATLDAQAKAEQSRQWDAVVDLAARRAKAAAALAKQSESYSSAYKTWITVNSELQARNAGERSPAGFHKGSLPSGPSRERRARRTPEKGRPVGTWPYRARSGRASRFLERCGTRERSHCGAASGMKGIAKRDPAARAWPIT